MKTSIEKKTFHWQGYNQKGTHVRGISESKSKAALLEELGNRGIKPDKIKYKPKPINIFESKKIKPEEITVFCRQLATMVDAGIPVIETLESTAKEHPNAGMRELLLDVSSSVSQGMTLADAFRKHPKYFDTLFCELISVAEKTGEIGSILKDIAIYKEKMHSLKNKIKKAMFYPGFVITIAVVVTVVLSVFVIPQFKELFEGFGSELPAFTQKVINVSNAIQNYWWVIILVIFSLIWSVKYLRRTNKKFLYAFDTMLLHIPILGGILQSAYLARISSTLSITSTAGIPLVESINAVAKVATNKVYQDALYQIRDSLEVGESLHASMKLIGVFPGSFLQMIEAGEKSGAVDSMLSKVSKSYEDEVDTAVNSISSLLEPVIMVVLGVIIGCFVTAMYLPIFNLGKAI